MTHGFRKSGWLSRLWLALGLSAAIALPVHAIEVRPMTRAEAGPQMAQAPSDFVRWRDGFRPRALAAGIRADVFDAAFRGVAPDAEVIRLDRRQAEFTKPIWEYLDTAVSDARITNGRSHAQRLARTLAAIEQTYGVEGSVVLAVWGMETNYGSFRGTTNTIEALATLAHDGRRRAFAEEQLIAALRILQAGDVSPQGMRGSWAGAMGHTQFIPTSYLAYAQDFNRDGRRDIWSEDPTDALASTAAYLARFGWRRGQPWGVEVRLPQGFNFGNIDQDLRRPVSRWTELGVRGTDGRAVPNYGEAALIAPAGARGPVFMVFDNFRVIKRYNNATSYAMGVGHLAHRIAGGADFVAPWPRNDRPLSRSEKVELQQRLTARGFSTGGADGLIGPNTMAAIRDFQRSIGVVPDGYASSALLQRLRGG
ncbi:lytic murein transglycosylase [Halovulum dunhuangense]|nr:lytic murein transglycosylase [Halovulum dunhuangense]